MKPRPVLSILTPAIWEREKDVKTLKEYLAWQGDFPFEHLVLFDDKTRSVGLKRQALLDAAIGEYVAFVDDDDNVSPDYLSRLFDAAKLGADVITFKQLSIINGKNGFIEFNLGHTIDEPFKPSDIAKRGPWHVCAWRRELVKRCVFPDSSYGEDQSWSHQARALARNAAHIDAVLHFYHHDITKTAAPPPQIDSPR